MKNYCFEDFSEVEDSIRKSAPSKVYKYRGDWSNKFHKEFITKQSLWFAAPRDLNDPYDIRTPVKFDVTEIENPIFFEKLKMHLVENNPGVAFTERDINVTCENKLEEIRKDPISYFERNYRNLRESDIYDRVGLFSCTADELNETMWAHYGNNHKGFAVGFNTVELCRNLSYSIGPVVYTDEVPTYSFISSQLEESFNIYFIKSTKWDYEKEFRFIMIGDDPNISRSKNYSVSSVVEFILGLNFPEEQMDDFISEVRNSFPENIPIYKIKSKISGFGLDKETIV